MDPTITTKIARGGFLAGHRKLVLGAVAALTIAAGYAVGDFGLVEAAQRILMQAFVGP